MKKTLEEFLGEIIGCEVQILSEENTSEDCEEISFEGKAYKLKIEKNKVKKSGFHYIFYGKNIDIQDTKEVITNLISNTNIQKLRNFIILSIKDQDIIGEDLIKTIESEIYGALKVLDVGYLNQDESLEEYLNIAKTLLIEDSLIQKSLYTLRDYLNKILMDKISYDEVQKYIFNRKSPEKLDQDILRAGMIFIENSMNISKTSAKLYIHRNTLLYRLDKIKEVLGLDIREFKDAKDFYIGIQIYMKNKKF